MSQDVQVRPLLPAPRRRKLCIACGDFYALHKKHRALTPLLLPSTSNPLRWASIWFPPGSKPRSVSASRRKLHYVSSFFLLTCDPLRWARSLVWKRFFQIESASLGFDLVPVKSKHRSVSALRRKLHYVSSFFLSKSNPLRWASIWLPLF